MNNSIPEIDELIKQFSRLPGLGPKSAKRIILKLINNKDSMIKPLAKSVLDVYKKITRCVNCGNLKVLDNKCICEMESNYEKICVVENLADMWVIESANIFKGHYKQIFLFIIFTCIECASSNMIMTFINFC